MCNHGKRAEGYSWKVTKPWLQAQQHLRAMGIPMGTQYWDGAKVMHLSFALTCVLEEMP